VERPPTRSEHLTAAAQLGGRHPLTTALGRLETVRAALPVVAAAHVAGLLLWSWGSELGPPLVMGAVATELFLGCRLVLLVEERRAACLEVIAEATRPPELPAVARERERLTRIRHQDQLARSVARIRCRASTADAAASARVPVKASVIREVRPELEEVERLLRRRRLSARATAIVEQLLRRPCSPLYGDDADPLRRELGRVRYYA
jgi:hypothetical protein